jgi:hypothetical protein
VGVGGRGLYLERRELGLAIASITAILVAKRKPVPCGSELTVEGGVAPTCRYLISPLIMGFRPASENSASRECRVFGTHALICSLGICIASSMGRRFDCRRKYLKY